MKDSEFDPALPILARDRARALRMAQTEVEDKLWQRLRNRQLGGVQFRRQCPVGPYITDFFCLEGGLVVELDGSQHGEEREREADKRRTEYLEHRGYSVLRFLNDEILTNIDGVLETIAQHLKI